MNLIVWVLRWLFTLCLDLRGLKVLCHTFFFVSVTERSMANWQYFVNEPFITFQILFSVHMLTWFVLLVDNTTTADLAPFNHHYQHHQHQCNSWVYLILVQSATTSTKHLVQMCWAFPFFLWSAFETDPMQFCTQCCHTIRKYHSCVFECTRLDNKKKMPLCQIWTAGYWRMCACVALSGNLWWKCGLYKRTSKHWDWEYNYNNTDHWWQN